MRIYSEQAIMNWCEPYALGIRADDYKLVMVIRRS